MADHPTPEPAPKTRGAPARESVHGGVRWLAISTGVMRGAAFATNIVVGYFVSEGEYGVVSLALALLMILAAMRESGLGQALVREDGLDADGERRAASTLFWILFGSNALLAAIAWMLAPWFSDAVSDSPLLLPIVRVVVGLLVIDTFLAVPRFLLLRHMQFSRLGQAQGIAAFAQMVTAIAMACAGFGAWSLVHGQIVLRVVQAVLSMRAARWAPEFVFDAGLAAQLFRFGRWLWAFAIVSSTGNRLDRFLLGAWFGESVVGIYAMALTICQIPVRQIANVVQSVAFPAFSRMSDRQEMGAAFARSARMLAMVSVPTALGLHATAPALVSAVLDDKWLPCVPIMQVLAFHGMLLSIATSTGPLLNALGKSRTVFFVGFVEQVIVAVLVTSFASYGPIAVAGCMVAAMVWSVTSSYTASLRALGMDAWPVAAPILRIVLAAALMNRAVVLVDGLVWSGGPHGAAQDLVRLAALVLLGTVTYAAAAWSLERTTSRELLAFVLRVFGVRRLSASAP
jgi:O-antigen/teichoic acid export membrane protein